MNEQTPDTVYGAAVYIGHGLWRWTTWSKKRGIIETGVTHGRQSAEAIVAEKTTPPGE